MITNPLRNRFYLQKLASVSIFALHDIPSLVYQLDLCNSMTLRILTRCQLHGDKLALRWKAPPSMQVSSSTDANSFWRSSRNTARGKSEFDNKCAFASGGINFPPLMFWNRMLLSCRGIVSRLCIFLTPETATFCRYCEAFGVRPVGDLLPQRHPILISVCR